VNDNTIYVSGRNVTLTGSCQGAIVPGCSFIGIVAHNGTTGGESFNELSTNQNSNSRHMVDDSDVPFCSDIEDIDSMIRELEEGHPGRTAYVLIHGVT
jgi:hypothetical protein